ncbi:MAG: ferrous iron transport protein B [Proteobacteria bacterium]|nr:ferrous iron transport protein B [Pseudomonadota bacterium]MBU1715340.1 ferrous iron transport protein B [Pseudomonadota bacterium]
MDSKIKIALAGNPNAGKTTLFNQLTGSRQHVGNYPGVTVEKKEGDYLLNGQKLHIVDLPGTYSLTAYSVEEVVTRDFLVTEKPDVVINIADASNLERNLYLTCQFMELGIPMVIALNMVDVARDRGIAVETEKLATLLGVKVLPIIARNGQGTEELMRAAVELANEKRPWQSVNISYGDDLDSALLKMEEKIRETGFMSDLYPARWLAIKYLEADEQVRSKGRQVAVASGDSTPAEALEAMVAQVDDHLQLTMETYPEAMIADHRYGYIKSILRQGVISRQYDEDRLFTSDRIDRIVTDRFLGPLIMLAVLMGLYHFTFTYSELPVSWLGSFFDLVSSGVDRVLTDGPLKSLLVSGIIDGVGGVLGFVPIIMFMFFGIAILEDSGYLARVAFMMDRIFRIFGLHGSSVMAYIISGGIAGGCAVPGVMATRTLRSPKERMATLLTAPFMNCGAKLPVLALLIGTFFAANQAQFMLLLTLLAWIVALVVAKFLRLTVLRGEATPFVMELPPYRFPTLKGLLIHTWEKTWQYIKKAGTVILAISILIWTMMTYPGLPASEQELFAKQRQVVEAGYPAHIVKALAEDGGDRRDPLLQKLRRSLLEINKAESEKTLRYSIAGRIGTALETVSWLPGFDWRTNIALVGGFAAKEVVISSLGTAYSMGEVDAEDNGSLAQALAADPAWNPVVALSLIVFIMFYAPCFVTVICIVRESGSWKWGVFSVLFNTSFAFLFSTLIYQIGSVIMAL